MRPLASPLPAGACDSHIHVFEPGLTGRGFVPASAAATDYQQVQARLGTSRTVIVQPRAYGTDNRVTLEAIARLGQRDTRGIAVLHPDVPERELDALHAGGIRGVRFTLYTPENAAVDFSMVEPLARRIARLGWHLQLHWTADQIVQHAPLLARLPVDLVFDHLARLPLPGGTAHPAFGVVRELLEKKRAWVKLSGAYLCSLQGAAAAYADVAPLARAWVACAPDRLVWGSDWPHTTEHNPAPDALRLLGLLSKWAPGEATRRRILVDNPAALYGF